MEEYTQITLTEWLSWKEDIRRKLQETARNFVYIGFRLKQIRDSGIYDGCQDIFEFANREYGLSKSTVSRFIAINEKFSEGGNSLELKAEYQNIGSSKLSEMLTLPDADCALITERTTVKEIRELKEFNRQELPMEEPVATSQQNPSALVNTEAEADFKAEVTENEQKSPSALVNTKAEADQQQEPRRERSYTPLQKCILDFFRPKEREEALDRVMDILTSDEVTEKGYREAAEIINPGGYCTHKKGLVFLFLYDWQQGVKYKLMTAPEPIALTWEEFLLEMREVYLEAYDEITGTTWQGFYKEQKTCCDVATESPGARVNTEAETDPEEDIPKASTLEISLRQQIMELTGEIRARIGLDGLRTPVTLGELRTASAAARKIQAHIERLFDITEEEK